MRILLFGRLRDLPPLGAVPASVNDVESLRAWLATERPALVDKSVRIAVNDEMVVANCPLNSSDEVSFLPPMSGG